MGTVRGLIERIGAASPSGPIVVQTALDFDRSIFERGPVVEIDTGVFLAPYPTDEEMFKWVAGGAFATVVSLLDPANPDDVQWIEREQAVADDYGIALELLPVPWMKFSPEAAMQAAERVRQLPRPVLVHAFTADGTAAQAFSLAYRTGLPSVSIRGFEEALAGGQAIVLAPHVVVGPRPRGPEFGSFLRRRGVRGVVFVGDASHPDAQHDRVVAEKEAGLDYVSQPADAVSIAAAVATGGPWYVYGPGLGAIQSELETKIERISAVAKTVPPAAAGQ